MYLSCESVSKLDPARSNRDETHLPTFEPGSQTAPRFPCAYGNQSWPQNLERAPRKGPEIAERISAAIS